MIRAALERQLNAPATASDVLQALERPIDPAEREDVLSLARWFRRRYPTSAERLAYVRRAYARWQRGRPPKSAI